MRLRFASFVALCVPAVSWAHDVLIFDVTPEDDWCTVVNEEAQPGDVIRLAPGDYPGPCFIDRTPPEEQDEYTMVMSLDPENPARILHDGESDSFIKVRGDQVMVMALVFEDIPAGVAAIEVVGEREIWIRYNQFFGEGATGVVVQGAVDGLHLIDNRFDGIDVGFSMDFGDGQSVVDLGDNLMTNVTYAAQIQGNWEGWIRDNIVLDVAHGFQLGAGEYASPLVVHGNWIRSTTQAFSIETGPLVMSNNIVQGEGSVWNLAASETGLGEVTVTGNSFLIQGEDAFQQTTLSGLKAYNNLSAAEFPVFEDTQPGSNLVCDRPSACWVDPDSGLFYPVDPVLGVPVDGVVSEVGLDFCGKERASKPTYGALEPYCDGEPEPFTEDFKSNYFCTYPVLGREAACEESSDTGDLVDPIEEGGCSCSSRGPLRTGWSMSWFVMGLIGLVTLRRRNPKV